MSHGSPGLDLNHGFIHVIRRHQLSEAEKLREEIATKQLAAAQRRLQEIENSRKQKRPDAPLYSSGIEDRVILNHSVFERSLIC